MITDISHATFASGMHAAFLLSAAVALAGALIGLLLGGQSVVEAGDVHIHRGLRGDKVEGVAVRHFVHGDLAGGGASEVATRFAGGELPGGVSGSRVSWASTSSATASGRRPSVSTVSTERSS